MAQIKILLDPTTELLTIFWQAPRKNQICTELDNGVILIKDEDSGEIIGVEIWSYRPGDRRLDSVNVEIGQAIPALT